MTQGNKDSPTTESWFGQMLGQAGLPSPQVLVSELQRLNANLERLAPDLGKMAASLEQLNPQDVRDLTSALRAFQERMWGRG